MIGMALYGRSMMLKDINKHEMGDPIKAAAPAGEFTREPGFWAYYEVGLFPI